MALKQNQMFEALKNLKATALAKYSHFHVAAILITGEGKHYSGINIESSSYSLTMCAERVALFKALSEGERQFSEIHILSDDERPVTPCGACRQVLYDYAPHLKVVMYGESGAIITKTIEELLPFGFNDKFLK